MAYEQLKDNGTIIFDIKGIIDRKLVTDVYENIKKI
jgi:hypothetical protein